MYLPIDLCMTSMDLGSEPMAGKSSLFTPKGALTFIKSDSGKKWIKYGSVSAIAIATSWVTFVIAHNFASQSLRASNLWAMAISTIPAFLLSRKWVWASDGVISMKREVIPFWVLSLVQAIISQVILEAADGWIVSNFAAKSTQSAVALTLNLSMYGIMWVGKFFFLNNLLFKETAAEGAL
jgi:putative flippase GtrA